MQNWEAKGVLESKDIVLLPRVSFVPKRLVGGLRVPGDLGKLFLARFPFGA